MIRSTWKPIYLHPDVRADFSKGASSMSEISSQNRSTTITQNRTGRRFQIYNGIRWYSIVITPERIGHLLGEFAPIRKRPIPKKKKTVKKN